MLPIYGLFRYEKDEQLLSRYYRPALNGWWDNIVREDNPLWTFIHATALPTPAAGLANAAHTLYRMPVDTIEWTVKNSQRKDIEIDKARDRFDERQATTLLPRDELPSAKWNSNPFVIDGGNEGRSEDDGTAFLLPYWMGRHLGYLAGE